MVACDGAERGENGVEWRAGRRYSCYSELLRCRLSEGVRSGRASLGLWPEADPRHETPVPVPVRNTIRSQHSVVHHSIFSVQSIFRRIATRNIQVCQQRARLLTRLGAGDRLPRASITLMPLSDCRKT
jgi:hypothetical protein